MSKAALWVYYLMTIGFFVVLGLTYRGEISANQQLLAQWQVDRQQFYALMEHQEQHMDLLQQEVFTLRNSLLDWQAQMRAELLALMPESAYRVMVLKRLEELETRVKEPQ